MSLIVTSNVPTENRPDQSEIFKPYSYTNNLTNTLKIPPNSEIALQSTKITKNGQIILSNQNGNFFQYFGVPIGTGTRLDATYATSIPMMGHAGGDPNNFLNGNRVETNTTGFITNLQVGMDNCSFHPALLEGYTDGKVQSSWECTVKRNAGVDFLGWNWAGTQHTAKTAENTTFNWTDLSSTQEANFTTNGGEVTTTTANGYFVQDRRRPVALNNGECDFDFSGVGGTGRWGVGLSRINPETNVDGDIRFHPEMYNSDYGSVAQFNKAVGRMYADIMVMRVGNVLRIYQSCVSVDTAATRNGEWDYDDILMKEITYWGDFNDEFDEPYDIATNADAYTEVRFKIVNEELKIYLYSLMGMPQEVLMCDFSTLSGNGGGKGNVTYPIHQSKWALYPTMFCRGAGNHLDLVKYDYQSQYPIYDANNYWKWDFQENLRRRGLTHNYFPESSWWNDTTDTTSGAGGDGLLTPAGIGGMLGEYEGFENILITAPTRLYDDPMRGEPSITQPANTSLLFGFRGRGVVRPNTQIGVNSTLFSDEVPDLISDVSLFVRLNNFTQNSINARQGTISKIVGHLPRFDNSGNDTGGLYFEPHEKTYLSLNNAEELVINSFDVDIVYDNETLCKALSGKTIVCFHIRQKPRM